MLRKYCTEFDRMSAIMMQAKNNIGILEFILRTVNVFPVMSSYRIAQTSPTLTPVTNMNITASGAS